ncbi:MAG: hypothetical protein CXZ00_11650 [Acidobacteria bacterium]|nr:MAG: hypothetical protein CXZ00_11650 [Acidobacteriota bacterium]
MSAIQPTAIKVHRTSGTTMEISWKDGHQSTYTFTYLRDACPCATCNEERQKTGRQPDQPASSVAAPLQMFKPQMRPVEVAQAGNYAIHFTWNDGHQSGVYSWDYLRRWCPCEQCHSARHSSDGLKQDIENHPREK